MNKAVFLDRDGTINVDYGYVHEVDKLTFIPGSLEALKRIQEMGYYLFIVTNQSGIGRGYFSREEYAFFTSKMLTQMREKGVFIEKIYTCPHTDADNCICRKPKTSLFVQAIKEYDIDTRKSFAIGDRNRDLKICEEYPVKGILLDLNPNINPSIITVKGNIVKFTSWEKIASYICRQDE